ncbi:ABC-type antimicrobial peptide transport system, permease component [Dyadobacter soli]|uniref:ABC-type antimicrobial peptide transport system, permease component n=1 Tax=Dyadobacter soli TaxID=659014 RepID=A0A1G7PZ61_9BACT|nr:ABC transporter permease [Dyadobacter soli]SDF91544.1 ABC-type antimicrobial peptide transport system, permease component [Dyadobacter soli]
MLRNYFKMAWRALRKQRLYSILNISGLAIGLATAMLLLLWIHHEYGYDRFHVNHERIVKMMLNISSDSQETQTYGWVAAPVADAMKREIPGVIQTSCSWEQKAVFTRREVTDEETGMVVDPAFLEIFDFPLLKGDQKTALRAPNSLIITRKLAEKYFGAADPIGQVVRLDQTTDSKIVGVLADIPGNSSLQFDFLTPLPKDPASESWLEVKANVFAMVEPKLTNIRLEQQLQTMTKRHLPDWLRGWSYFPHKLDDLYLQSNFKNGRNTSGGRITYVHFFTWVAVFVLLIAVVNFVNLSTARATERAREVGVRKAVGAGKWMLIGQFLGESMLLTGLAGIIALGIIAGMLPVFNNLLQKHIVIDWLNPLYWAAYLAVLLVTGLLAGLYPAFVLSGFKPVLVLNGLKTNAAGGAAWLRKGLVIIQFTAASMLLVGTGVVYQQIDFIRKKNLGYQQHNLIRFEAKGLTEPAAYQHAKTVLANVPGIEAVSGANASIQGTFGRNYVEWGAETPERVMFTVISGDHDLLSTLQTRITQGRNFSTRFGRDSLAVILNEAAARRLKLKEPLGKQIRINTKEYQIIGITKDFHVASAHQEIEPTVILYNTPGIKFFFARISTQNQSIILQKLNTAYQTLRPGIPLNFQFLDQEYNRVYQSEMQIGSLAKWFSVIAVLLSCMGLFGLASFSVERRTKEIAIRKVLGASLASVFSLITRDFVGLVGIALVVAAFPSWYIMNAWLGNFAYSVHIGAGLFVLVGALTVGLAILTVSWQSIRAAIMNPVDNLRAE